MAPIASLCLSLFGLAPLPVLAGIVAAPGLVAAVAIGLSRPALGRLAVAGWLAGMAATVPYDAFRLGLVAVGVLGPDPIPRIGEALAIAPHGVSGYAWRFLGNGGGMGLAFASMGLAGVRQGLIAGLAIVTCLLVTLAFSPKAQSMLFPLNGTTVAAAMVGHLIYGGVLGAALEWWRHSDMRRALHHD